MANKNPKTSHLPAGNPGNRGGGQTKEARETKQAFLDAILGATKKDEDGNEIKVADLLKQQIVSDALNPSWRYQSARQWLVAMQHGQPAAKTELVVSDEKIGTALAQALYETEGIDAEKARAILTRVRDLLTADVG